MPPERSDRVVDDGVEAETARLRADHGVPLIGNRAPLLLTGNESALLNRKVIHFFKN